MIWFRAYRLSNASTLLALCAIIAGLNGRLLQAGEPIVFGNAKPKVEPDKEKNPVKSPFKLDAMANSTPFGPIGIMPPILPRSESSPRKDRRQQNAADEKKNWMFLQEGELQRQDDEKDFLGGRDDDFDDKDRTKGRHDFTFKENPSTRNPNQPRALGMRRGQDPKQPPPPREVSDDDSDSKKSSKSSAIVFGNPDHQSEDRLGSGSDLQSLLGNGKASDQSGGASSFSMRNFLSGSDYQRNRDQDARTESFKQLLGGSPSMSGLSDPVNSRSDFARQPLNPTMPSSFGNSAPKSFAPEYVVPRSTFSQPNNNPANYLTSPDAGSRGSGFGAPPAAPGGWKPTEVQWPRSRF